MIAFTGSSDNDVKRVWLTDLTVVRIPEPASRTVAGLCGLGLLRRGRRR